MSSIVPRVSLLNNGIKIALIISTFNGFPLRGGNMKKMLFVVAFLSLAGVARIGAVGETQADVNAPRDVKVQVEKEGGSVREDKLQGGFEDQCLQKGMTGTFERVNADGTSERGRINTDVEDSDEDDDDDDDDDEDENDGSQEARFQNVDNSARVFDRE